MSFLFPAYLRRGALVAPALALVLAVLMYPLFVVVLLSFTDPKVGFDNYIWFFDTPINLIVLMRTFSIAAWVTLICTIVSYPYAFLMTIVGSRVRVLMFLCVLVPFWVSGVVRTLAWVILLQDSGLINQILVKLGFEPIQMIRRPLGVTIGMVQVLMPFMIMPLYSVLKGIDLRLVLAARSLGASPIKAFKDVYLPLSLPGIFSGALIVMILSLGFYLTPMLLGGPSSTMLSTLIQQQIQAMLNWGRGSTMGVVLLVMSFGILALVAPFTRVTFQVSGGAK